MPLWQSQCQWQSYTHSQTHTHPSDESGPECLNWVLIGLDWCDILKKIPIYFDSWAFFFLYVMLPLMTGTASEFGCIFLLFFFYLSGIVPSSVCCCRIFFFHWIVHIACMYLSCMVEVCSLFQFQCCHQSQIHSLLIRFASVGGWKRSKHILSIFAVKIVLELTLTRSFDVVMVYFFSSFIPSYFDSSCSYFVGVLCFIFAAIQTPFMPNCVSFRFKRKFCVCQNNVACSSRECSLFIHVFKSNRRERKKKYYLQFVSWSFHSKAFVKWLWRLSLCQCCQYQPHIHQLLTSCVRINTFTRTRTQTYGTNMNNNFRWFNSNIFYWCDFKILLSRQHTDFDAWILRWMVMV